MKDIHPLGGLVLVRVPDVQEKTKSGLYLASETIDREKLTSEIGTIVEIGPLAWEDFESRAGAGDGPKRWGAEEGMQVLFARQGGKTIKHPDLDDNLRLLNDTDILAAIVG